MAFEIEDVMAVSSRSSSYGAMTAAMFSLKPGQSFGVPATTSYQVIYNTLKAARNRLKNPLKGELLIVKQASGWRVGRVV